MSIRDQPFFGKGRMSAGAMAKLNQLATRNELFGPSPVMNTPHNTVLLNRRRNYGAAEVRTLHPWQIYQRNPAAVGDPPMLPDITWRTFAVHKGLLNDIAPRRDGTDDSTYSTDDDTATGGTTSPILLTLTAELTYAVWVRQTYTLSGDTWIPAKTYVEFGPINADTGIVLGWPGFERGYDGGTIVDGTNTYNGSNDEIEQPVSNVLFKLIGIVTLGSDTPTDDNYRKVECTQILNADVSQSSTLAAGQPYNFADDPTNIGADEWRQFRVHNVTVNGIHALREGYGYSDDTGADADMQPDEATVSCVYVRQTLDANEALDQTYLDYAVSDSTGWGVGYDTRERPNIRNVFLAAVATVTIGQSGAVQSADYMRFTASILGGAFVNEPPSLPAFTPFCNLVDPYQAVILAADLKEITITAGKVTFPSVDLTVDIAESDALTLDTSYKVWITPEDDTDLSTWIFDSGAAYPDNMIYVPILEPTFGTLGLVEQYGLIVGDVVMPEVYPAESDTYGNVKLLCGATVTAADPDKTGFAYVKADGTFGFEIIETVTPPVALTHKLKWLSGGVLTDNQPATPRGHYWLLGRILQPGASTGNTPATVTSGEVWHVNESTCLEFYEVAGWIDYSSAVTGVSFSDGAGGDVMVTIENGLITDPSSGTIYATDLDGTQQELTINAGGTVTGYVGEISVGDPSGGATIYLRITSEGRIAI